MFLLFFLIFLLARPAHAAGEFKLDQNLTYQVQSNGTANLTEDDTLTNVYSQIYLKEYRVSLTEPGLAGLQANDDFGNILSGTEVSGDTTGILLKFNQPGLGKDQKTHFVLNYTLVNFARKKGKTWEISLPQFDNQMTDDNLNITLDVPASFGDLSSSSIQSSTYHNLGNINRYQFSNPAAAAKIVFVFGDNQLFDFNFDYYLNNDSAGPVNTEIALPPDTDTQTVHYTSIDPPPQNITSDADGNWLAHYPIPASSKLKISASGQAKITPPKHEAITIIPADYTSSQKYWPVSDPAVVSLAGNLTTPESVYNFVVSYLRYDYDRLTSAGRLGALYAIQNPSQSLCTEFSDLFVTLARNRQIPAREIEGFAYSNDSKIKPTNPGSDILHAWPQYYDSRLQTWISVDPTWEKTTNGIDYFHDLDLNHFAFVIHGLQSDYPSPPGAYKENQDIKTVSVDFATSEIATTYLNPTIKLIDNHLQITNPNLSSLNNLRLTSPDSSWSTNIGSLPPLGSVSVNFSSPFFVPKSTFSLSAKEIAGTTLSLPNPGFTLFLIVVISLAIFLLSVLGIILTSVIHKK